MLLAKISLYVISLIHNPYASGSCKQYVSYWKEQCLGLMAETSVDEEAMELQSLGGTYGGNRKATHFMCLVMKVLQIQPGKEIVVEFIKNENYKWTLESIGPLES